MRFNDQNHPSRAGKRSDQTPQVLPYECYHENHDQPPSNDQGLSTHDLQILGLLRIESLQFLNIKNKYLTTTTMIINNYFGLAIIYYQFCYIIIKIHISSKLSIRVIKKYHNVNGNCI